MNTVDTALREKLEHIWNKNSRRGSINQRMISDIEALIRSLTNEAELRGRVDELDLIDKLRQAETSLGAAISMRKGELAALLKLPKGAQDEA